MLLGGPALEGRPYSYLRMRRGVGALLLPAVLVVLLPATLACGGAGQASDSAARAAQIDNDAAIERSSEQTRATTSGSGTPDQESPATVTAPASMSQTTVQAATVDQLPASAPASGGGASVMSTGPRRIFTAADRRGFAALSRRLLGRVGVAVTTLRGTPVETLGSLQGGVAWSTAKAPVAMAAIAAGTAAAGDLRQAITASDNAAAERLWAGLGAPATAAGAATGQLRGAGDRRTTIESRRLRAGYTAFGQTYWRLADQARFVAGMGCSAAGRRVLTLMGSVISSQRWGLGQAGGRQRLKGGWGPGVTPGSGDGWMERQMGIIDVGGRPLVVAIASDGPGHEADMLTLTTLAKWVAAHADTRGAPTRPRC